MAVNEVTYRKLLHAGIPHHAALFLADPDADPIAATAVANPAALTSPADIAATYSETAVQQIRDDVAALRTTVQSLLTSLRNAGVLLP